MQKNTKQHSSEKLNKPKEYAVDGVLYYAKYLKNYFNVIAIAISGTSTSKLKANTFYWVKGQDIYTELIKAKDIILEPDNYLKLVNGEKMQKSYSLEEINQTAINIHTIIRLPIQHDLNGRPIKDQTNKYLPDWSFMEMPSCLL